MARKAKELIKAATIATALDKVTGKILGWAVKSNSSSKYYQVTTMIIDGTREFFCDCEAKNWGCSECCHVKAIKEMLVAKAEIAQREAEEAIQQLASFEATKAEIETIEASWSKEEAKAAVAEAEKIVTKPIVAAPQFQNTDLTGRGFVVQSIPELNGRMVPLKVA